MRLLMSHLPVSSGDAKHAAPCRAPGLAAALVLALALTGCANRQTTVVPSEGHITPPPKPAGEILAPVKSTTFAVPPPKPQIKPPTYSVVVNDVPVKELLQALARDTRENIDVHPGLTGLVSLNAINETLPAILERVSSQVSMRIQRERDVIFVLPDTPYLKTYRVNYVNMSRDVESRIGVSGEVGGGSAGAGGQGSGGGGSGSATTGAGNTSQTRVQSQSKNNFWELLQDNVRQILTSTRALNQTERDRAERAEAQRTAREERLAQAEAVARAGAGATALFKEAFSAPRPPLVGETRDEIVANPIAGTLSVLATERQHMLIQQHIDHVTQSAQRQVLIEATIVEVRLSDRYRAGVDWSRLKIGDRGFDIVQNLSAGNLGTPPAFVVSYINPTSRLGDIAAAIRLLEQFGNTRVLSSPKLMSLNNQTALLKVVNNAVYFTIQAQAGTILSSGASTPTAFTTTVHTVPVGVVMSVTPQINENGQVTISVRPTISSITGFKNDPNPALAGTGITNAVPEIQMREMESVLQVGNGQTVILGGLMQDEIRRARDQIPGAGSLSGIGDLFAYRDDETTRNELIIFLKPTVISNPSLDTDELKFYQRFLPQAQGRAVPAP